jgi:hypothetical protein
MTHRGKEVKKIEQVLGILIVTGFTLATVLAFNDLVTTIFTIYFRKEESVKYQALFFLVMLAATLVVTLFFHQMRSQSVLEDTTAPKRVAAQPLELVQQGINEMGLI